MYWTHHSIQNFSQSFAQSDPQLCVICPTMRAQNVRDGAIL